MAGLPRGICLLAFTASVFAQNERASLIGTISDPTGVAVDEAPIQVKNKNTGAIARTSSKSDGRYTLAGLAPGTYELSIIMPCCAYKGISRDIALEAGQTRTTRHIVSRRRSTEPRWETIQAGSRMSCGSEPRLHPSRFPATHTESQTCRASGWPSTTPIPKSRKYCRGPPR